MPVATIPMETIPESLVKRLEDMKRKRANDHHPDYNIIKIGKNIGKRQED